MKFQRIAMILGLSQLNLKAGMFGHKPFVKLDEGQLTELENALVENSQEDLQAQIENLTKEKLELENKNQQLIEEKEAVENALEQALNLNEIEAGESVEQSIEALAQKCKEYGSSQNRNTLPPTDGKDTDPSGEEEKLIGGFMNPEDEIYQTLGKL